MFGRANRAILFLLILITSRAALAQPSFIVDPYLQNVQTTSLVIQWQTSAPCDSRVIYGSTTAYGLEVYESTLATSHAVYLSGLTSDTTYHYKVFSTDSTGTVSSADSTFRTAFIGAEPFRFVAYGDTRSYPSEHAAVISAILASAPRFVLHTGDFANDGTNASAWRSEFFRPAQPLLATTCLYPTFGNHEYHASLYYNFFTTPSGGGTGSEQWYSFNFGNSHFISLDTEADYSPGSAQYNWLVRELQAVTTDWLFVFTHYPAFSSGAHGGSASVRQWLVPLFEQYGVDMVFTGHDHLYERSFNNGIYYIVTGGGGAPLYSCGTTSNPASQFCRPIQNYCVVDINGLTATFSARDKAGTAFDTLTLSKVAKPKADFAATPMSGLPPLEVYFTDKSGSWANSWSWDFGDGATSTQQNPSHQYASPGSYTVSLTASGPEGLDTETKSDYIAVGRSCHIGGINITVMRPPTYRVRATVTVHDHDCKPLAGANVTIKWSGFINSSSTRTSNSEGQAVFVLPRSRRSSSLSCCVTRLVKAQYLYDSSKNHTTCASTSGPSRPAPR